MTTQIFKDYSAFLLREDRALNGVSEYFAQAHPEYEKENEGNDGCWNCSGCSDCSDCSRCSDCSDCSRCSDCSDCSGCSDCSDCSRCSGCSDCSDCSDCSRCSDLRNAAPLVTGNAFPEIPVKSLRFEHVLVWEAYNGKVPEGMQIHHKDQDKTNNHISNLQLVTPLEHKRLHEGCILVDGEWLKPCKDCGEYKKCNKNNWYYSRGWISGRLCKPCFVKKSLRVRQELISKGWKRKNYKLTIK